MDSIVIKDLTKRYKDVTAVDGLSLRIGRGELFSLLGVNGAGKTTAVKMLSCLASPDSGDAFVSGYSIVSDPAEVRKRIALSPQETAVAPNLTVHENLALMCGIYGFSKKKTQEKISELSERLKLDSISGRKAGKLSGGWQRRLSLAMALTGEPEVLFLDEPTLGLDVLARAELWELIDSLRDKMTIVLTTHYMEEAEQLSDHTGIMKDGKLLACGTVAELIDETGASDLEEAFIKIVRGNAV